MFDNQDQGGMLTMPLLDHLSELRTRIIRALAGWAAAFALAVAFSNQLWSIVTAPAASILVRLGYPPDLVINDPMEPLTIVWMKLPLVVSLFLAAPWVLYQLWAFIAPGLYARERRWAGWLLIVAAVAFIGGGAFAYFVAFRYALEFLLGLDKQLGLLPLIPITLYFGTFVNVVLAAALTFELPVVLFLLSALGIVPPQFWLRHCRYAVLCILLVTAVITPTPDPFNLLLFALPLLALFFVGVVVSWFVLQPPPRRWKYGLITAAGGGMLLSGGLWFAAHRRRK